MANTTVSNVPVSNPGYKTTEFWLAMVGMILPVINQIFKLDLPQESIYTIVAYILGRSGYKAAVNVRRKGN